MGLRAQGDAFYAVNLANGGTARGELSGLQEAPSVQLYPVDQVLRQGWQACLLSRPSLTINAQ